MSILGLLQLLNLRFELTDSTLVIFDHRREVLFGESRLDVLRAVDISGANVEHDGPLDATAVLVVGQACC